MSGNQLDDVAQQVDGKAVTEVRTRLESQRQAGTRKALHPLLQHRFHFRIQALQGFSIELVQDGMLVRTVTEPARVGQQVVDRHFTPGRHQVIITVRAGDHHPGILELRQVARDRVRQAQPALFAQQHGSRAGNGLAHRVDPENGSGVHRAFGCEILPAASLQVRHLATAGDQRDDPGKAAALNVLLHDFIQAFQPGRR